MYSKLYLPSKDPLNVFITDQHFTEFHVTSVDPETSKTSLPVGEFEPGFLLILTVKLQ